MRAYFLLVLLNFQPAFAFQALPRATSRNIPFAKRHELIYRSHRCGMFAYVESSIPGDDDDQGDKMVAPTKWLPFKYQEDESMEEREEKTPTFWKSLVDGLPFIELFRERPKLPPMQVDDTNLLLYDIFLIVNLSLSISFWVTYRMDFTFLPIAFSEGCLLSIFWIASGLYHGMFLYSAVDGHYGSADDRGGPKAAATLALNTYINAVNLRLVFAFLVAVAEHRPAGMAPGEQLLPLEIGFGLLLMSSWRALHSSITPRI